MALLNSIVNCFTRNRLKVIESYSERAVELQWQQLAENMSKAAGTAFGKQYGFKSITDYKTFAERVPVCSYEQFCHWIERTVKGERDVVWPGAVKWFAKSSGTTNAKSKFIPVTDDVLQKCHYQGGRDVMAVYISQHPETRFLKGKNLTLGGSKKISTLNSGSFEGDLSAIMLSNTPWWLNLFKTPKPEIALLEKWEEKVVKITEATIKQDVTSLVGVPSWFLVLINHVLKTTGKKNLHEVWPNLELFIHGGINFTPYRDQYKALAPKGINFLETYNASEGFFALQDDPEINEMLLMLDYGVFYEFVPLSEVGKEHPDAKTIGEVEPGVDYAMVISTNGGLWRYMIGDTVRFTSVAPYRIVISGRTKHFMNAFGEEVMIDNAEKALKKACDATGAEVCEYTAAPVFMAEGVKGCHEWLIEFSRQPDDLEKFRSELDLELQRVNSDYEAKRYKDITLGGPIITVARQGQFIEWLRMKGKLGGQNKVPRLQNDRKLIEELKNV